MNSIPLQVNYTIIVYINLHTAIYKTKTLTSSKTKDNIFVVITKMFVRYLLSIQYINQINNKLAKPNKTADLVVLGFSWFDFQF